VDALKVEEEKASKDFEEKKAAFDVVDNELNEKLGESAQVMHRQEESAQHKKEKKKQKESEILKEKAKEVEEKISKKKKLTTEDLLAYQAK
ncbi:hypothetical protein KY316_04045, partial [Candidatus Woesearchaeota archaeon]|nr:hypothetical protein [Candidatus Woesearchaeota archaeon]